MVASLSMKHSVRIIILTTLNKFWIFSLNEVIYLNLSESLNLLALRLLAPHEAQAFTAFSNSIFSKYSPKTSQIQFLEEASTGQGVGATP